MRPSPTKGIARERVRRNIAQSIRDVLQKLLGRPVAYRDCHFDDIIRGSGATRASRSAVSGEPVYHFTQHAIAVMAERRMAGLAEQL